MLKWLPILVVGLVVTSRSAVADEEAKRIIARAIAAQGGRDAIAKRLCCHGRINQVFYHEDGPLNLVIEYWSDFSGGKAKFIVTVKSDEHINGHTTINVLNGDQGWTKSLARNITTSWDKEKMAETRDNIHAKKAYLLFPLIEDPDFELSALGEQTVENQKVVGVKITSKDRSPVLFYFDKTTYLLVKSVKTINGETFEEYFHSQKVYQGVMVDHKSSMYRDGKLILESETIEFEPLKSIDPAVFAKP